LFLGSRCTISNSYADEINQLARAYGPRGAAFYAVVSDPEFTPKAATEYARLRQFPFPVLLDPNQELAEQGGVHVTPEAMVLDNDGQVLYAGRIDDLYGRNGRKRSAASSHDLRAALDAVCADEMPAVSERPAIGSPLPRPTAPSATDAEVTYHKDVAPILRRNCIRCHRPGEVGPFPLLSYRDAAKRAQFLKEVTTSGRMPPWKPEPGHGAFRDTLRLNDREKLVIAQWADDGAPEGDQPTAALDAEELSTGWQLGKPNIVYKVPEPFTIPAGGPDLYRAFVVSAPHDQDLAVLAFELRPGNRAVVHHAKLFVDPTGEERARDAADPGPGHASAGAVDIGRAAIWEWTPGTFPRYPPAGAGYVLKAGTDLVLFVHYHPTGKPEVDQSSVGLYLSKAPLRDLVTFVAHGTTRIDIPAGESRHRIATQKTLSFGSHAFCVMPHGHFLMREISLTATCPDGTVRHMIWIKDWDFNWQGQYTYSKPIPLPKGTRLDLVAYYDNSAANPSNPFNPPRRVRFGPTSYDEMLGCNLLVIPDKVK
jgi:hypothetical protein